MTETMWRCDQVRAGRLYNRMMFDTREEAEQFAHRMQQMEPDQMFSIEPVEARSRSGIKDLWLGIDFDFLMVATVDSVAIIF